jgi:hypothetical protein
LFVCLLLVLVMCSFFCCPFVPLHHSTGCPLHPTPPHHTAPRLHPSALAAPSPLPLGCSGRGRRTILFRPRTKAHAPYPQPQHSPPPPTTHAALPPRASHSHPALPPPSLRITANSTTTLT